MAITSNKDNKILNKELSIQISLSGLSFCILQRDSKTITFLKTYWFEKKLNPFEVLDKLKHVFNSENELQSTFSNVIVIHSNELSTLVPKALFNEDALADYLKFNSKILRSDFITFDTIEANDSVNVYVPYVNINNFIYELFGAFTYKHVSTVLIEQLLLTEKNAERTKMYVNVSKGHFEMVVIDKSSLLLYNTFEFNSDEDFIYYILFVSEQLGLNPETLQLVFLGDIQHGDSLYNITYKYIRHIDFGNRNDLYNFVEKPENNYSNYTLLKSF
ncbi:DUF3822 family protein [Flavobacteriaceae bacterium XHP0103]|uniref:DUF3822 family protein n=1 Tax=Marixanthotalea marina TaxID=2844359 RepID=UPI002989B94C|nr:DUF3822 family protein [Marixanthotalea marina]MBU3823099.1 DUF3822 family protein [Marixanthotalea marina]